MEDANVSYLSQEILATILPAAFYGSTTLTASQGGVSASLL
jgi:hypothetical protein